MRRIIVIILQSESFYFNFKLFYTKSSVRNKEKEDQSVLYNKNNKYIQYSERKISMVRRDIRYCTFVYFLLLNRHFKYAKV
jgi:hypothetical protein